MVPSNNLPASQDLRMRDNAGSCYLYRRRNHLLHGMENNSKRTNLQPYEADLVRAKGKVTPEFQTTVNVVWGIWPNVAGDALKLAGNLPGGITPNSKICASICEVDSNNVPIDGLHWPSINNVMPEIDRVLVNGSVNPLQGASQNPINIQVTFLIANP